MKFTEEMINEDEKRWHARDVVTELGYCGNYMMDRRNITNLDIRFYAYIMRKAYNMLKEHEKAKVVFGRCKDGSFATECGHCGMYLDKAYSICPKCNKELDWNSNQD